MNDGNMIKNIELNNFRAFEGKKDISFLNDDGEISKLVFMYAPNGTGKTSFIDAVEWVLTGEINRLNNIGNDNFEGKILGNMHSGSNGFNVKINLDNGEYINRVGQKLIKKDKGKGKLISDLDGNSINNYDHWTSLILPHDKIDDFIAARKPSQLYEEWSSLWDTAGKGNEVFDFIRELKKSSEKKVTDIENKLSEVKRRIKEAQITEDSLTELNNLIGQINAMNKDDVIKMISGRDDFLAMDRLLHSLNTLNSKYSDKLSINKDRSKAVKELQLEFDVFKTDKAKYQLLQNEIKVLKDEQAKKSFSEKNYISKAKNDKEIAENEKLLNRIDILISLGEVGFEQLLQYFTNLNIQDVIKQTMESLSKDAVEKKSAIEKVAKEVLEKKKSLEGLKLHHKDIINCGDDLSNVKEQLLKAKEAQVVQRKSKDTLNVQIGGLSNKHDLLQRVRNKGVNNKSYRWIIEDQDALKLDDVYGVYQLQEMDGQIVEYKKEIEILTTLKTSKEETLKKAETLIYQVRELVAVRGLVSCPICNSDFGDTLELLTAIDEGIKKRGIDDSAEKLVSEKREQLKILEGKAMELYLKIVSAVGTEMVELQLQEIVCKKSLVGVNEKEQLAKDKEEVFKGTVSDIKEKLESYGLSIDIDIWDFDYLDYSERVDDILKTTNSEFSNIEKKLEGLNKDYNEIINQEKESENRQKAVREDIIIFQKSNENIDAVKTFIDTEKKYKDWKSLSQAKNEYQEGLEVLRDKRRELVVESELFPKFQFKSSAEYNERVKNRESELEQRKSKIEKFNMRLKNLSLSDTITMVELVEITEEVSKIIIDTKKILSLYKQLGENLSNLREDKLISNEVELEKKLKSNLKIIKKTDARLEESYSTLANRFSERITSVINGRLSNDLYRKIDPHSQYKNIRIEVKTDNKKPELYIKVIDENDNALNPEWYFSTAQLNVLVLCIFISGALRRIDAPIRTIFIDDPIGHFDDMNVLAFLDVLRSIIETRDVQIIITTHDRDIYELAKMKLSEKYYLSKFIELENNGA